MNKKAIAILGGIFILIVGTLGFIIWKRSSKTTTVAETPTVVEQPTTPVDETPVETPPAANQATKLTDDAVVTPALFFQGDGIAYFNRQGQLFRTSMSTTDSTVLLSDKKELTVPTKSSISRILWPAVGNSYIAESGAGSSRQWSYYNPDSGNYIDLPGQVKSVDWVPSGGKILFVWVGSDGKATLNISDPDTNNYKLLTDLYEPDNEISISPDGQTVLFYRTQVSDQTKNTINSVSIDGKTFKTVVRDGYNKEVLWAPDSKKFLFTRQDPSTQKFNLWLSDLTSGEVKNLGVATSTKKAVWTKDSSSIVVGVPTSGLAGQGITNDTVYKIEISSNTRTEFSPGTSVDVEEPFLNLNGDILFFRNAQDGSLYYLMLK